MFRRNGMFEGAITGMFGSAGSALFGLSTLQADPNCVLIQDPSAIWGGSDHLPRRNLLTYSEDFSNAVWSPLQSGSTNPSVSTNASASPDGTTTADRITFGVIDAAGDYSVVTQNTVPLTPGTYFGSVYLKAKDAGEVGKTVFVYLAVAGITRIAHVLTDSWVRVTNNWAISTAGNYGLTVGALGSSFGGANQVSVIVDVWGAQLTLASTTDQSYQRITDWTTEQYAWAATKNVPWLRRNMLGYTGDLSNAAWGKTSSGSGSSPVTTNNYGTAPDGTQTAHRVQFDKGAGTASTDFSSLAQTFACVIGYGYIPSIYIKLTSGSTAVSVYLDAATSSAGNYNGSLITVTDTWQRVTGPAVAALANPSSFRLFLRGGFGTSNSADVLIWCPQISAASCDYQRIATTWPAEYTSLALAAGYPISLYSDRAGTTATYGPDDPVGKLLDLSGDNNHATAPGDAQRPVLRLDGNGKFYLYRDATDDALAITWPANFTTTAAQYVANQTTTTETTGITLNGATSYNTPQHPTGDYGRIIFKTPTPNAAKVKKYLDKKAGR